MNKLLVLHACSSDEASFLPSAAPLQICMQTSPSVVCLSQMTTHSGRLKKVLFRLKS